MSNFNYESIPAGYYDHVYKLKRGIQSKWHHLKFDFFAQRIKSSDRVLDIGCGPGTFLGNLESFTKGCGIDISPSQIDYANEHYGSVNCSFECFDGNHLPYENNSFDVVTLVEVIEHLLPETVETLFSEAYRVLKNNGRLYVSTPNYGSLWPVLETVVNRKSGISYEEQHINFYKRDRLNKEIEATGFKQTNVRAYQFLAPFLAGLSWSLANGFNRIDRTFFSSRIGFLLFAEASKQSEN
jgi:SAM-dependent methyltransferase